MIYKYYSIVLPIFITANYWVGPLTVPKLQNDTPRLLSGISWKNLPTGTPNSNDMLLNGTPTKVLSILKFLYHIFWQMHYCTAQCKYIVACVFSLCFSSMTQIFQNGHAPHLETAHWIVYIIVPHYINEMFENFWSWSRNPWWDSTCKSKVSII